jgi:sigma-B regulation protein RsbU (phosphoserine phosphatase)
MTPARGPEANGGQASIDALRAENARLRESDERLGRILASSADYVYTVRVEAGRPIEARHGQGCLALTGYSSEELAAQPRLWLEMALPEDRPLVEERARRLDAGEDCPPIEYRIRRKDGSLRWVSNTTVVHRSPEGRVLELDGFARDITERRNAEEALRASEARLKAIFEAAPVGIGVVVDRRLVELNGRMCQMIGYPAAELVGRSVLPGVNGLQVRPR